MPKVVDVKSLSVLCLDNIVCNINKVWLKSLSIYHHHAQKTVKLLYINGPFDSLEGRSISKLFQCSLRKLKISKLHLQLLATPHLVKVDFSGASINKSVNDEYSEIIRNRCLHISYLNISGCSKLSPYALCQLVIEFRKSLKVFSCKGTRVNGQVLSTIGINCTCLKALEIGRNEKLTESDLIKLFFRNDLQMKTSLSTTLKVFNFDINIRSTAAFIVRLLSDLCPSLASLENPFVWQGITCAINQGMILQLKHAIACPLDLDEMQHELSDMHLLKNLPQLSSIIIRTYCINVGILKLFQSCNDCLRQVTVECNSFPLKLLEFLGHNFCYIEKLSIEFQSYCSSPPDLDGLLLNILNVKTNEYWFCRLSTLSIIFPSVDHFSSYDANLLHVVYDILKAASNKNTRGILHLNLTRCPHPDICNVILSASLDGLLNHTSELILSEVKYITYDVIWELLRSRNNLFHIDISNCPLIHLSHYEKLLRYIKINNLDITLIYDLNPA